MRRSPLHAHVALPHDPRLARVERELELALQHDAVVERHGAVHGRLGAGGEVDHAHDAAVGVVQRRLVFLGVAEVRVVVEVDGRRGGRVEDVGHGLLVAHDEVVVAAVCGQEHALAVGVVACDVADCAAEARGGEAAGG